MKYARIVNDTAVDVRTESPEGFFTPEVVAQFVEVPEQVQDGWLLKDGEWSAPPEPTPVPPPPPEPAKIPPIGPIAFQLLFTAAELIACDAAKDTDPAVRIFWKLLDDPRTDAVDRNIPSVQDAIRHLETAGCIGTGRADELINASL